MSCLDLDAVGRLGGGKGAEDEDGDEEERHRVCEAVVVRLEEAATKTPLEPDATAEEANDMVNYYLCSVVDVVLWARIRCIRVDRSPVVCWC